MMNDRIVGMKAWFGCNFTADKTPMIGTRDRWWVALSVPWLARKLISFMLSSVSMSITNQVGEGAPIFNFHVRSRLGGDSHLKFILDGKYHFFDIERNLMFGLLSGPAHSNGEYCATIDMIDGKLCLKIERILSSDPNLMPVHVIWMRKGDEQMICMENRIYTKNVSTGRTELSHSHTELFRRNV